MPRINYKISNIARFNNFYRIDTNGVLWMCHGRPGTKNAIPKQWRKKVVAIDDQGRPHMTFMRKKYFISRLVAQAFIPNSEQKPVVCHNNGNPADNRVSNLRWGTQKENIADTKLHGTRLYGEKASMVKLNNYQIIEICKLQKIGMTQKKIGGLFGVHQSEISRILSGKRWGHLSILFNN